MSKLSSQRYSLESNASYFVVKMSETSVVACTIFCQKNITLGLAPVWISHHKWINAELVVQRSDHKTLSISQKSLMAISGNGCGNGYPLGVNEIIL